LAELSLLESDELEEELEDESLEMSRWRMKNYPSCWRNFPRWKFYFPC